MIIPFSSWMAQIVPSRFRGRIIGLELSRIHNLLNLSRDRNHRRFSGYTSEVPPGFCSGSTEFYLTLGYNRTREPNLFGAVFVELWQHQRGQSRESASL